MQYGYFDDINKEYVITRPDTPKSWSNYLGLTEYGAIITNNAGGYSFYKSGGMGRFVRIRFNSIPMDQPGRYIYLHDHDSKDYWSASFYYTPRRYIIPPFMGDRGIPSLFNGGMEIFCKTIYLCICLLLKYYLVNMNYLLVLIITIVLFAFILLGLSLKSLLRKGKSNNLRSCKLPDGNGPECACSGAEKCVSHNENK